MNRRSRAERKIDAHLSLPNPLKNVVVREISFCSDILCEIKGNAPLSSPGIVPFVTETVGSRRCIERNIFHEIGMVARFRIEPLERDHPFFRKVQIMATKTAKALIVEG